MCQISLNGFKNSRHNAITKSQLSSISGRPDGPRCKSSKFAFYADDGGACSDCVLELGVTTPVIPNRLSIWAPVGHQIRDIELVSPTGLTVARLGPKEVFCDMPFTTLVSGVDAVIDRVRIHATKSLSIDAVMLESKLQNQNCQSCTTPVYNVHRQPAFDNGDSMVEVKPHYFVDRYYVSFSYFLIIISDFFKEGTLKSVTSKSAV